MRRSPSPMAAGSGRGFKPTGLVEARRSPRLKDSGVNRRRRICLRGASVPLNFPRWPESTRAETGGGQMCSDMSEFTQTCVTTALPGCDVIGDDLH